MEATNTLVRFGERLGEMRETSHRDEGKQLLDWVAEGGLESLESGIEAFLTAAAEQPAGSVFYEEEKETHLENLLDKLAAQYGVGLILAEILDEDWHLHPGVDDVNLFAAFLAGMGVTEAGMRNYAVSRYEEGVSAWVNKYKAIVAPDDYYVIAFLRGYGDTELLGDALNIEEIYTFVKAPESPFPEAYQNLVFAWYLAGRGYTVGKLEKLLISEALQLVKDANEVVDFNGSDTASFYAFLWGHEAASGNLDD